MSLGQDVLRTLNAFRNYIHVKGSKSDAAIANIPCGINVLEEDISENPESYIMFKVSFATNKSGNPTNRRSDLDLQPHQQDKYWSLGR